MQYTIGLAANPSNPAHEVTFPPNYIDLYKQKPKAIKSFGIRISPLLESAGIKPQNVEKHFTPNIPARCMKQPEILFDLYSGKKSESNPHIDDCRKMQSRYKNYKQIYTDGSKEDSKVGCAVISDNHSNIQRIPDDSSIFKGAQWLSGRVLDSRPKGRGFEPHRRHCVVSLSKNINPSLVRVQPRKTRPFITERLLMGRKESNKQTNHPFSLLEPKQLI